MRASHILVKYQGSRRKASWKDPDGIAIVERTEQDARDILDGFIKQLEGLSGNELFHAFSKIATTESDCGSAPNGGDLGDFSKGMMQKPFEDATLSLGIGEMSGVVKTDSGLHIILRVA